MKNILLFVFMACLAKTGMAQYKPIEQGSSVKFVIKNLGFNVHGSLSGFEGTIDFDPRNIGNSKFNVSVNAATINTDNSLRDEHLKGDGYFDVKNNPRIKLESGKVSAGDKTGSYRFNGMLTIKGKTEPLTFPFTAVSEADKTVFKGTFKINRKDFGIGGISTVANELEVDITVTAKK